jgi:hypothetical protein
MGILSSADVAIIATARGSGGRESIGAQFICRDSGFVERQAQRREFTSVRWSFLLGRMFVEQWQVAIGVLR